MAKSMRKRLEEAREKRALVRFTRPWEKGHVKGYLLDVGPRWLLLALVGDSIRYEGFQCFRTADVRELEVPAPHRDFVEAALRKRGERRPAKPKVSVTSLAELLLSADRTFPLVAIHCEQADPDVCWIGRVRRAARGRLSLLQMDPDAQWWGESTEFRLSEITRVDFGGGYEEALHLVGGDPPES